MILLLEGDFTMTYWDFSSNFEVIFKLWNLPKSSLLCDAVPTTELTNRRKIAINIYFINWAVYALVSKKTTPSRHIPPHRGNIEHGWRFLRELNLRLTLEDRVF